MPTTRNCYSCLWFKPTENKEDIDSVKGECRRLAPRPMPSGTVLGQSMRSGVNPADSSWPLVKGRDWCGQWRDYRRRPQGHPVRDHI